MSVPALADLRRFTVIDLGIAGCKLVELLNEANERHRNPALGGQRHHELEYGLGGLSAVGVWVRELRDEGRASKLAEEVLIPSNNTRCGTPSASTGDVTNASNSVRIMPIVPTTAWYNETPEELQRVVALDLNDTRTDQRSRSRGQPYFYSPRSLHFGQTASPDIQVQVNVAGFNPEPAPRDLHAYFATLARSHPGTSVQSGPFLVYGGVRVIRELRVWQMSPHASSGDFEDYSAAIYLETLALVLLSHLCVDHGAHEVFLSLEDWRRFTRNTTGEEFEVTREWVAAGQLRDGGELPRRMARWLLEQPNTSGHPPAPRNGIREADLSKEIDNALRWIEGFFHLAARGSLAAPVALAACELGKSSSAYYPQDRRLARRF
ncbi:hypothetical protein JCM10450v2_004230 [Rhodotorula kratochvilovae]